MVYGQVNPIMIKYNETVEIIINNHNFNLHPWHMHGHHFQVLERSGPNTGTWPGTYAEYPAAPIKRDTVMLQPNSYAIIRFRADNPDECPPLVS
jgi:iron transport multicopper oxidase